MKKEIEQTEKTSKVNPLLIPQGAALKRMIKHSGIPITELAKKLGVERQTIYIWQRAEASIPEEKVLELSKILGKQPAEIRYDITLFSKSDLSFIVRLLELELTKRGITLQPEKKAVAIASMYTVFANYKKILNAEFAKKEFESSLSDTVDGLIIE